MTPPLTLEQLPQAVGLLTAKVDRMLAMLEKSGLSAAHSKQANPGRRIIHAKEACTILGKSLSTLYRAVNDSHNPLPSYKRGKLLCFYEDELHAWVAGGKKHEPLPTFAEHALSMSAGMKRRPAGAIRS